MGQNTGLAKPADAIGRAIALEIAPPLLPCRTVAGQASNTPPGTQNPRGFLIQVFGQIADRCGDLVVDGMGRPVCRVTQRNDPDRQAAALQCQDFLGNEGFRQTWITFQNKGNRGVAV